MNKMDIIQGPKDHVAFRIGASCGSANVTERFVWSTFDYGAVEPVVLTVIKPEPVITCSDCKESFTDYRSEEIRDATVEQYRRMFAPRHP